jgi:4-hydroxybenzoate polyprenyltransferase
MSVSRLIERARLARGRTGAIVRWNNWAYCKIAIVVACLCYATLARDELDAAALGDSVLLFAMLCCYAAFGYAINSFSDAPLDASVGKYNPFSAMSPRETYVTLGKVGVVALSAGAGVAVYYWRPDVAALVALGYGLAAAYSLAPFRLKGRGLLGVIASPLAQHAIPAAIVFTATRTWDAASISLCGLSTLIGLRFILVHQLADKANDAAAKIRSVATIHGGAAVWRVLTRIVFPIELAMLALAAVFLAPSYPAVPVAVIVYVCIDWLLARLEGRSRPFMAESYGVLSGLYFFWLPVILAAYVCAHDVALWPMAAFTLAWTGHRLWPQLDKLVRIKRSVRRLFQEHRRSQYRTQGG